jgi:hypothetical protein
MAFLQDLLDAVLRPRKVQIRRGNHVDLPNLDEGELGLTRDGKKVWIGTGDGNVLVGDITRDEVVALIAAHNADVDAHDNRFAIVDAKIHLLELVTAGDLGTSNQFTMAFNSLDGLTVAGVWNESEQRLEF